MKFGIVKSLCDILDSMLMNRFSVDTPLFCISLQSRAFNGEL